MTVRPRTLLGFDYGLRRIGVAVGQEVTGTAAPLRTLAVPAAGIDWSAIGSLIEAWRPEALVVGLPRNMDGTEHAMTQAAQRFARRLHGRYGLPVFHVDERLSSQQAEGAVTGSTRTARARRRYRADIDRVSAQIILQTWLNEQARQAHGQH